MKFLDLVKKRQSVRKYLDTPVEREKIERCLEAARLAPSASNSQPWTFIVVDNPELKDKVAEETFSKFVSFNKFTKQAPVLIIIITEKSNLKAKIGGIIKNKQFNHIDIGITTEHFCLQAAEEGLGTCIMGWFDEKKIKKILNIPRSKRIDLIISLGYPASDKIRKKHRTEIDGIRSYNEYKEFKGKKNYEVDKEDM